VIGERRHPVAERVLAQPREYHAPRRIMVLLQLPIRTKMYKFEKLKNCCAVKISSQNNFLW